MPDRVHFLTLGCDKNRVDGEVMVGALLQAGFVIEPDPSQADAVVVNTCGFIRDAVQESVDAVLHLAEYKKTGQCKALIIAGCMAQRYKDEIAKEFPEADAIIGVPEYDTCARVLQGLLKQAQAPAPADDEARLQCRLMGHKAYGQPHIAYVKIAEGCDNRCTYCTIPSIRGGYVSRSFDSVLRECRRLVKNGAKELILVAQDTAKYPSLHLLLGEIAQIKGLTWVRLMYAHPEHITPALIQALALPKVARYLDMPVQHAADPILKRMGRKITQEKLYALIRDLRRQVPGIALRTTLLTGFPGETQADFDALCQFVQTVRFERLGVFGYSRERGTPAARMRHQINEDEIQARRDTLMRLQQQIHKEKQAALVGTAMDIMIDHIDENGVCIGRSQHDAPEVDTVATLKADRKPQPGQILPVVVTATDEYDLICRLRD
jgi:ribosomal protein S12 methylthiotransferase